MFLFSSYYKMLAIWLIINPFGSEHKKWNEEEYLYTISYFPYKTLQLYFLYLCCEKFWLNKLFKFSALHIAVQQGHLQATRVLLTESQINAEAVNAKYVSYTM